MTANLTFTPEGLIRSATVTANFKTTVTDSADSAKKLTVPSTVRLDAIKSAYTPVTFSYSGAQQTMPLGAIIAALAQATQDAKQ